MGPGDDFIAFLDRYEVLQCVVAFFIVIAAPDLVKSLTENVLMPLISFLDCPQYFLIVVALTFLIVGYVQKRKTANKPKK